MESSLKISLAFEFVNRRAIGSNFWLCRFLVYIFQTKQEKSIVGRAQLRIPISYFNTFNKTWFKISFSFNLGLHRITSETKKKFLMKLYEIDINIVYLKFTF